MVSAIWIWWVRSDKWSRLIAAQSQLIITIVIVLLSWALYQWHKRRTSSSSLPGRSSPAATPTSSSWITSLNGAVCCISCSDLAHANEIRATISLANIVPEHRVIVCSKSAGMASIVRQIEPQLFLAGEADLEALTRLNSFMKGLMMISERTAGPVWDGQLYAASLQEALCSPCTS